MEEVCQGRAIREDDNNGHSVDVMYQLANILIMTQSCGARNEKREGGCLYVTVEMCDVRFNPPIDTLLRVRIVEHPFSEDLFLFESNYSFSAIQY